MSEKKYNEASRRSQKTLLGGVLDSKWSWSDIPWPKPPLRLNADLIQKTLLEKIQQRTSGSPYELRKAFRYFDTEGAGRITYEEFRKGLRHFNLEIPDGDFSSLCEKFDPKHCGWIAMSELVSRVLPRDLPADIFTDENVRNTAEYDARFESTRPPPTSLLRRLPPEERKEAVMRYRMNFPPAPDGFDLEHFEQTLQEKLLQRTRADPFQIRRLFKKFDRNTDPDITYKDFRELLNHYNIPVSDENFRRLVSRYDRQKRGKIDLSEFVHSVLPHDHPRNKDQVFDGLFGTLLDGKEHKEEPHHAVQLPYPFSVPRVEQDLREKIHQRCIHGPYELRHAFNHYDRDTRSSKITPSEFEKGLKDFNIFLPTEQLGEMIREYDVDGDGTVNLDLLLERVLIKDYPGDEYMDAVHRQMSRRDLDAWSRPSEAPGRARRRNAPLTSPGDGPSEPHPTGSGGHGARDSGRASVTTVPLGGNAIESRILESLRRQQLISADAVVRPGTSAGAGAGLRDREGGQKQEYVPEWQDILDKARRRALRRAASESEASFATADGNGDAWVARWVKDSSSLSGSQASKSKDGIGSRDGQERAWGDRRARVLSRDELSVCGVSSSSPSKARRTLHK